jgi:hypothetical protein
MKPITGTLFTPGIVLGAKDWGNLTFPGEKSLVKTI